MQLSQFKLNFIDQLKNDYPSGEINSFFQLITQEYLGLSRLDFALNPQRLLTKAELEKLLVALRRLQLHEPIQYILGATEFFGLHFLVNKNVLIPRPETEELVQWILDDHAQNSLEELSILDIGTGSGCIAISLAAHLPNSKITAVDISKEALNTARANAKLNKVDVNFIEQDILSTGQLDGDYNVIVSNPPYVRELEKGEMHRNVLENEPYQALYVNDDNPLVFYNKITKLAKEGLKNSGRLYFEINQYLAEENKELVEESGFKAELKKDIYGNYRMLKGTRE